MSDNLPTVYLHHPRGPKVLIPLCSGAPMAAAEELLKLVGQYLDAGWLVTAPGLEEGEHKETYAWVSRVAAQSRSGECSRVFLYIDNDAWTHKHIDRYLNTDADVDAFERATGIKLASIPVYPGKAAPERGNREIVRFIIKAPTPFEAIWKNNPDYTEGSKTETKRLFVRWANVAPATPQTAQEPPKQPETTQTPPKGKPSPKTVAKLAEKPTQQVTTDMMRWWMEHGVREAGQEVTDASIQEIHNYALSHNWEWDTVSKCYDKAPF